MGKVARLCCRFNWSSTLFVSFRVRFGAEEGVADEVGGAFCTVGFGFGLGGFLEDFFVLAGFLRF